MAVHHYITSMVPYNDVWVRCDVIEDLNDIFWVTIVGLVHTWPKLTSAARIVDSMTRA